MFENSHASASVAIVSAIPTASFLPCNSFATATRMTSMIVPLNPSSTARLASFSSAARRIRSALALRNKVETAIRNTIAAASNAAIVPRPSPSRGISATSPTTNTSTNRTKRGGATRWPRPQYLAFSVMPQR